MKVVITDTFVKSLKKVANRERWYWKTWDFIRYDIPNGIKNLVYFFPTVWGFRGWDYGFQLKMLKHSLLPLRDAIRDGHEVDDSRLKKVAKIERAIEILDNITNDRYTELAEKKLGYEINVEYFLRDEPEDITKKNRTLYDAADKMERSEWNELWKIFKGQDINQYVMISDKVRSEGGDVESAYRKWFDGSGLRGWWD